MSETSTISSGGHAETGSDPSQTPASRRMLIDGNLVETQRTFPSINPATGDKTFATVVDEPLARREDGVDEPLARREDGSV
jgi:hypothetical protein